jgi:acylphosphatase
MVRWICFLSGRVQGVGMRYWVNRLASQLQVAGFVENLDDGRVRIVVEGQPDTLEGLIESIRAYAPGAIRNIERHVATATGEFANFTIKR